MKRVTVIGLDGGLSEAAVAAIREADVLAGGKRQLAMLRALLSTHGTPSARARNADASFATFSATAPPMGSAVAGADAAEAAAAASASELPHEAHSAASPRELPREVGAAACASELRPAAGAALVAGRERSEADAVAFLIGQSDVGAVDGERAPAAGSATGAVGCVPELIEIGAGISDVVSAIAAAAGAGKRVVVVASGDPLLFGIGATLIRELGRERVEVLPGVSSVQRAFARIGEPWHEATVLSAHGRTLDGVVPAALAGCKVAILTDGDNTPSALAGVLLQAGMENCRAVVCERLGETVERVVDTTLEGLAGREFDPLNILLLLRNREGVRLDFGRTEAAFKTHNGQITKPEVRAVILSKLRLPPYGVLWDIGAGSGSVAIEAGRLMPRGRVFAIERDPEQLGCLRDNRAVLGARNVEVIEGEAPEALAGLPAPQAVFIGGSGGRLTELMDAVPRPFVASFAVLEHVGAILNRFPQAEVVELNVARSAPMAGGHRLAAQHPVYVVSVPA